MKQGILITIMFGIVLLSFVSAIDYNLIAGGSITIPLSYHIVNCSIENNSSNLDGLNLFWYGKNVTISTVINYKPDTFTLSCGVIKFGEFVEEEITPSVGGWRCAYEKDFDWNCSDWGECIEGTQTRTCKKYNNCGNFYGKPLEVQNCTVSVKTDEHGCSLTEGYTWCESKQKCLNLQEEDCVLEEQDEEKPNRFVLYLLGIILVLVIFITGVWILYEKIFPKDKVIKSNKQNK